MSIQSRQKGFTLIEAAAALAALVVTLMVSNSLLQSYYSSMASEVTAQQTATVGNAVQNYVQQNYAALTGVATATTPAVITVPMLQATGFLSSGFSPTNNKGQTLCALVLQPTANNLQTLVVSEGGTAINDLDLGTIAGIVGATGGGIYGSAPTVVRGAMGGWSFNIGNFANSATHCDGSAGAVALSPGHPVEALWFNNGAISTAYLYRSAVPGHPELNTMNTPLIMASVQANGGACSTVGAIAQDGSGGLLSCNGTAWQPQGSAYWKDPVASFVSLPACNAAIAWQTRVVQAPTVGVGPRAYTCNGVAWKALAVDDSGNLVVPGGLTVSGNSAITGNETVGGTQTVTGNMSANTVTPVLSVAENSSCAGYPSGALAQSNTTAGLTLSCQSGMWRRGGGISTSGGVAQLWKAVAGQSISCYAMSTTSNVYGYGMVDANGIYYARVTISGWGDSGWVQGSQASMCNTFMGANYCARASLSLAGVTVIVTGSNTMGSAENGQCGAKWS